MAMKLIGMESLRRKLARIPAAVRKRAQADLMLAGREINMLQRSLAPHEDGNLRASIRTEPLGDGEIGAVVRAGGPLTTVPVRNPEKGNAPFYDYAIGQETGTKDMPPNSFFWPGWKARKGKAKARMRKSVKEAMREAIGK